MKARSPVKKLLGQGCGGDEVKVTKTGKTGEKRNNLFYPVWEKRHIVLGGLLADYPQMALRFSRGT